MTKEEMVAAFARATKQSKRGAQEMAEHLFALVGAAVIRDGHFAWAGFGVFRVHHRRGRRIRNPNTKELMDLPAHKTVGFRPAKTLRGRL